ncbi:glycosyltransferase [Kluyvera genomosp. 1]|uniref:glycosyltransferase n=1 Tax=Kluyvera genomosp. 1 TaxID=2774053 RepID=UPI00068FB28D|nr:glycosyltransferase [Kluyvera genomosp. 1]
MNTIPHVAILLAAYNGDKYIKEQLQSLVDQSYSRISIFISDDSKNEDTYKIVQKFILDNNLQNVFYRKGPQESFVENFLSMVNDQNIIADYYAFCDQDDIWHTNKIKTAVSRLCELDSNTPNIYCGRTRLVNEVGTTIGFSPLFKRSPSFRNALVQNIAGGNTMVFNHSLKNILSSLPQANCISHDWLAYLIATACNGTVIYSPNADIDYRQHGSNIIGSNKGIFARVKRLSLLFKGDYRKWNSLHDDILSSDKSILEGANKDTYDFFTKARNASLFYRVFYFFRSKVYRQSLLGNIALLLGVILKKV